MCSNRLEGKGPRPAIGSKQQTTYVALHAGLVQTLARYQQSVFPAQLQHLPGNRKAYASLAPKQPRQATAYEPHRPPEVAQLNSQSQRAKPGKCNRHHVLFNLSMCASPYHNVRVSTLRYGAQIPLGTRLQHQEMLCVSVQMLQLLHHWVRFPDGPNVAHVSTHLHLLRC
jgi:hypothetical protein